MERKSGIGVAISGPDLGNLKTKEFGKAWCTTLNIDDTSIYKAPAFQLAFLPLTLGCSLTPATSESGKQKFNVIIIFLISKIGFQCLYTGHLVVLSFA